MGCFGYVCKGCGTPIRGNCYTGGEKCVLIHVRHGEELGCVEGHYNEYGGVIEQEGLTEDIRFMGSGEGINSHSEICESLSRLEDSYLKVIEKRLYKSKEFISEKSIDFSRYCHVRFEEDLIEVCLDVTKLPYYSFIRRHIVDKKDLDNYLKEYEEYLKLKEIDVDEETRKKLFLQKYCCLSYADILIDILYWSFYEETDKWFRKEFEELPKVELENYSGIVAYHSVCYHKAKKEGTFNLIPSLDDINQSWGKIRKKYI